MHKKFEINGTKIKGGCQSGRKVVTHNSKSDLPLTVSMKKTKIEKKMLTTEAFQIFPVRLTAEGRN